MKAWRRMAERAAVAHPRGSCWGAGIALLAGLWVGTAPAATAPTWPLNDTGIDWCANGNTNNLACPVAGYPWQDAQDGRDATQDHDGDGHAGFAFTKLDANGGALAASASAWSCVRDNVTGLIWEVRTKDGGLRDWDWTYSWYNPDPATNGGFAGYPDYGNNCYDTSRCDTAKFAADVNQAGLCGASDWRLPTREELRSLVDYSRSIPAIDNAWFPDMHFWYWSYWSSSPGAVYADNAWYVLFYDGYVGNYSKNHSLYVRLVRDGQSVPLDDHGNTRGTATPISFDSRTAGRIDYPGDNDYFRLQVRVAGVLTLHTTGTTDSYGYLLDAKGNELAHNDDASATNANFRIARSLTPGTYYVRIRHASTGGTGAYTLVSDFRAATGKPQRAVLLLHGMNSDPGTWNELVKQRWSARCEEIYGGVVTPKAWAQDDLGAICYRLRFGRYDATGSTGLEDLRCNNGSNPEGCKGDFTALFDPAGNDLGVEVFLAVRAILARLGSDTQVVLLGHSRGGLAARAFLQRPTRNPERKSVVGLVTTGTPHRGSPLGRIYTYLATYCLDGKGQRINSSNRAGQVKAIWSACENDWEAVDDLNFNFIMDAKLYLGKPTIKFLAPDSSQIQALNAKNALANLPTGLSVVQLRYVGQYLGHLATGYSAWNHPGGQLFNQFSLRSRDYALCGKVTLPGSCPYDELTPAFNGDGIVPIDSQGIPGLEGVPGLAVTVLNKRKPNYIGVYHTKEPKRSPDIDEALGYVQAWK